MQQHDRSQPQRPPKTSAFLVIREGDEAGDVIRLTPGQVTTVGRSPTNRIVIRDEVCSRRHCEIFQSDDEWMLRDLGSRNGTTVNGKRISGDWGLIQGELIRIGSYELGFTLDLGKPFSPLPNHDRSDSDAETAVDLFYDLPNSDSTPAILHRKRSSRYRSSSAPEALGRDRTSRELARLYRLAMEMGSMPNSKRLAEVVLSGLLKGTSGNIGAILLFSKGKRDHFSPSDLQLIAYQGVEDVPYQKVSDSLSKVVFTDQEAVLASDVSGDSRLATRDSLGEIQAKSVICAPIRVGETLYGLVHLYSTNLDNPLDPDDLEFTLAVADQLAVALENLIEKESLAVGLARVKNENVTLRRQLEMENQLIGDSPPMRQLRQEISRAAPTGATVLIRGESGVGKELVARAIHFGSKRRSSPFVCMNCAALSESLLESELFGHEKGSFTGATERKFGKFEQASNGTLFLDEVGEMSTALQAKFLRVLEGHPFERVGGGTPIQVDVRVVAATNANLEKAVENGRFRKDLYFRVHVVQIAVEPLRRRRSDIPLLASYFLDRFARKTDRAVKSFSPAALKMLKYYDWPGNVRELQNAVERAVIVSTGDHVTESDIQLSALGSSDLGDVAQPKAHVFREQSLDELEQEHILATLEQTNWNKSKAAQILQIERSTLDRKLKRYQVSRPKQAPPT